MRRGSLERRDRARWNVASPGLGSNIIVRHHILPGDNHKWIKKVVKARFVRSILLSKSLLVLSRICLIDIFIGNPKTKS